MTSKTVLLPGPNHPITTTPTASRVVVTVAGQVVADTRGALALQESTYPVAYYIPREDVEMSLLERTNHDSYCPFKGDASYFSIPVLGEKGINTVWTYEAPYDAVADIKDYLAFYPDRVDSIVVSD